MKNIFAFLSLIIALGLSGCFKEEWEGFVYPNKNDLTIHKNIGVYKSLESCRAAAWDMLYILNATERGTYECGLNCEYRDGWGSLKICEKTVL